MVSENFIEQRQSDEYFNATLSVKKWNRFNPDNLKNVSEYQRLDVTKEFVQYLKEKEGIENPYYSSRKGTWMHPILYLDFCMWISVEFKVFIIKYAMNGLIKYNSIIGEYYNEMCLAIMERHLEYYKFKPEPMVYIKEANMINEIAGITCNEKEITKEQVNKVTILQRINTQMIKEKTGIESRKKLLQITSKSLEF